MRMVLAIFVGVVMLLDSACISDRSSGSGAYAVRQTVPSPANKFDAVLWEGMGGGAAGWCYRRVSILVHGDRLQFDGVEASRIDHVFSTRCSSQVKIDWKKDDQVKISYSLGDDPTPTSMSQAGRTADGKVHIAYEVISDDIAE